MINIREELKSGRIFHVTFVKKNGTIRSFNARLGVTSHLKGGKLLYNPEERNNLVVFSMEDKGYRTISLNNILRLKTNGSVYYGLKHYELTNGTRY